MEQEGERDRDWWNRSTLHERERDIVYGNVSDVNGGQTCTGSRSGRIFCFLACMDRGRSYPVQCDPSLPISHSRIYGRTRQLLPDILMHSSSPFISFSAFFWLVAHIAALGIITFRKRKEGENALLFLVSTRPKREKSNKYLGYCPYRIFL
jgi:hypothetical protein